MATILIIGSIAWDDVVRLDKPLRAGSHNEGRWIGRRVGGGAANTALALARGQDIVRVISAVAADEQGAELVAALDRLGVDVHLVDRRATATTRSLILLETGGERTVINLARAALALPDGLAELPAACCYVRSADPALTAVLARRIEIGTVVAHVPPLKADFRPAQVLVGSAFDLDEATLAAPFAAGWRVAGSGLEWMVLTYGPEGAIAYSAERRIEVKAPRVEAIDTTGAGDVFAAGLVHGLAAGLSMEVALETAVKWGSVSVGYEGTVPPEDFLRRVARCDGVMAGG
ncbi:MAG: PfkB family carbohydrate kinase [Gammaproteobacteria bacterium]